MTKDELKAIYKEFKTRFAGSTGAVGVFHRGDWTKVRLGPMALAFNAVEQRRKEYGCDTPDAILVDWIPDSHFMGDPRNTPPEDLKIFPSKEFKGVPIFYKQGAIARALQKR